MSDQETPAERARRIREANRGRENPGTARPINEAPDLPVTRRELFYMIRQNRAMQLAMRDTAEIRELHGNDMYAEIHRRFLRGSDWFETALMTVPQGILHDQ